MLFTRKNQGRIVGIDIGTTSIKVLEMSRAGRSVVTERYGLEVLTPGVVTDHKIQDIEEVALALRRALKTSGTKTKRAAVCVPGNQVISKVLTLQAGLDDNELESAVEVEADRIVPYALDEVNIDFVKLGKSTQTGSEEDVQVVACRKSIIEELSTVLEEAGLEPAIVDVDTFILGRVRNLANQNPVAEDARRTGALIDFGANASRFMVFHDNVMIYHRDNSFGGRQLVDSIHQKYGMSHDSALAALRKSTLPDSFKGEVLKPFVKILVQEIIRALQFFYSSSTHNAIDELMITGGCAQIGNIEKIIAQRVGVPTFILNPFATTRIGAKIDKSRFRKDIPSLAIASGLALRGIR